MVKAIESYQGCISVGKVDAGRGLGTPGNHLSVVNNIQATGASLKNQDVLWPPRICSPVHTGINIQKTEQKVSLNLYFQG